MHLLSEVQVQMGVKRIEYDWKPIAYAIRLALTSARRLCVAFSRRLPKLYSAVFIRSSTTPA